MKITRSAPVRIGHPSQVDLFIIDQPPPKAIIDLCRHNGVQAEVADSESGEEAAA
jgi:DeoR family transcriptional regulator, glycerol-3-phosphate regulon repressor